MLDIFVYLVFFSYFQKAIEGTRFEALRSTLLSSKQIEEDLLLWHRIVCFYTLRLMLAPHGKYRTANQFVYNYSDDINIFVYVCSQWRASYFTTVQCFFWKMVCLLFIDYS